MTQPAAVALGIHLRLLAESAKDSAAQVIPDTVVGDYHDLQTLARFAQGCDVLTFDHEHVPTAHLEQLVASGVAVRPSPAALVYAQDKALMRERLARIGSPLPRWQRVKTVDDVESFAADSGFPVVIKAARGGYDGKGVWVVGDLDAATNVLSHDRIPGFLVEDLVPFSRELSAVVARSPSGQAVAYPVVETVQRDGICHEVIAPAPGLPEDLAVSAQKIALEIAGALDVVGVMAVELFEPTAGLLVNERAMRPHNSGHWTIEGAVTSQFENHLRAVLDLPLGDTTQTAPAMVMANVLGGQDEGIGIDERVHHLFAADPGARVHLYGKQVRPGRKIGHVTVLGDDLRTVRTRAARAARWLQEGI